MPRQRTIYIVQSRTGLHRRREVRVLVRDQRVQTLRAEKDVNRYRRTPPSELRASAANDEGCALLRRRCQRGGNIFGGERLDDVARQDAVNRLSQDHQNRSPSPAFSIGCA